MQKANCIKTVPNLYYFTGDETLALSKIIEVLDKNDLLDESFIFVKGKCVTKNIFEEEKISKKFETFSAKIDSYIRCIYVDLHKYSMELSIGGSNATAEDIAASEICLQISEEAVLHIKNTPDYQFLQGHEKNNPQSLKHLAQNNELWGLIAISKKTCVSTSKKDKEKCSSVDYLTDCFDKIYNNCTKSFTINNYWLNLLNFYCESFRSTESICNKNSDISLKITKKIIGYVDKTKHIPEFIDATIYLIESLGYVAKSPESIKLVYKLIIDQIFDTFIKKDFSISSNNGKDVYPHLIWSSVVALERVFKKEIITKQQFNILKNAQTKAKTFKIQFIDNIFNLITYRMDEHKDNSSTHINFGKQISFFPIKIGNSTKDEIVVLLAQTPINKDDFKSEDSQTFHILPKTSLEKFISEILLLAENKNADIIVFPEYSIPIQYHDLIQTWSAKNKNTIIIAGSDTIQDESDKLFYNTASFFQNGKKLGTTEKFNLSKHEYPDTSSSVKISSRSGHQYYLKETIAGTIVVLICADCFGESSYDILKEVCKCNPDILCVIACQDNHVEHYMKINSFIKDSKKEIYVAYSNPFGNGFNGGTSFWAKEEKKNHDINIKNQFVRNDAYDCRQIEIVDSSGCIVFKCSLPPKGANIGSRNAKKSNVYGIEKPYIFT